jgi:hypothetical protein
MPHTGWFPPGWEPTRGQTHGQEKKRLKSYKRYDIHKVIHQIRSIKFYLLIAIMNI